MKCSSSLFGWLSACTLVILTILADDANAQLQPWSENSWYWSRNGQPVLLLGGSDDDNLFQWPQGRLLKQLDRIASAGGNVVRNTMSDRQDGGFEVYPFHRRDDGKYDLREWNREYWDRFEFFLSETSKRNMVVQIEVWDRFDLTDVRAHDPYRWEKKHPYNPANNVNYTFEESGFARRYPEHPGQNKQPFFFTTPQQRNNRVVLEFQERFVQKLLDHSLKYDHVLYCIDNETKAEPEWGTYWARLIRERATRDGKRVMVTEMWDDWDLKAERHRQTFDYPELYDYVDVSQNNQLGGQEHWDNFLYVRRYLGTQPRPMNTTKTYGADGNKFGHSDQDAIERFWRHLLAGAASIRFHRPKSGLGIGDKAVSCLRAARQLEGIVPLWDVEPANHLLTDRDENEAFVAAGANGDTYALYLPRPDKESSVSLKVPESHTAWRVEWIPIDQNEGSVVEWLASTDGVLALQAPSRGNWAAMVRGGEAGSQIARCYELFGKQNLVAWCIVPFDAKKRSPEQRVAMLGRLGLSRVAYDWRSEHVPSFREEFSLYREHGLEWTAFWDWHEQLPSLVSDIGGKPQVWITAPSPPGATREARVRSAAEKLSPLVQQTKQLGLVMGLYNHGGWGGRPENLVAVCEYLRRHHESNHVGIVYNLHHAHHQMQDFDKDLAKLQPYLLCLNLNGMVSEAELQKDGGKKIQPIGTGGRDTEIVRQIIASKYRGPIGILDHRSDLDAEQSLRQNLIGLSKCLKEVTSDK